MNAEVPAAREGRAASDVELVDATAAGDERAFEELRSRYQRAIDRICHLLAGVGLIEDCVQEVMWRLWRKAALFDRRRGSVSAWLLTVARNVARSQPRIKPTAPIDELELAAPADPGFERAWLHQALASLPELERRVLELAYFEDLTQVQIAAKLGAPLGTVKTWNRRALNRLADQLQDRAPP